MNLQDILNQTGGVGSLMGMQQAQMRINYSQLSQLQNIATGFTTKDLVVDGMDDPQWHEFQRGIRGIEDRKRILRTITREADERNAKKEKNRNFWAAFWYVYFGCLAVTAIWRLWS